MALIKQEERLESIISDAIAAGHSVNKAVVQVLASERMHQPIPEDIEKRIRARHNLTHRKTH